MLIFKAGIKFVLGSYLPPPENQFHDGIDSHKKRFCGIKRLKFGLRLSKRGILEKTDRFQLF
jgi:hypothetical protein